MGLVIMATAELTLPIIKTLSVREIEHLVDRLFSNSVSKAFAGQPRAQADMRLASRVLRGLLIKLDKATGSVAECARLIAEIEVEA